MSAIQSRIGLWRSVCEILGIAFLRFRPLQRAWVVWLVLVGAWDTSRFLRGERSPHYAW